MCGDLGFRSSWNPLAAKKRTSGGRRTSSCERRVTAYIVLSLPLKSNHKESTSDEVCTQCPFHQPDAARAVHPQAGTGLGCGPDGAAAVQAADGRGARARGGRDWGDVSRPAIGKCEAAWSTERLNIWRVIRHSYTGAITCIMRPG